MSKTKKQSNIPSAPAIVPQNIEEMAGRTHNIYESLYIVAKRANQIHTARKEEISGKMSEFAGPSGDNLEEIHENREQIELSKGYERMAHPSIQAIQEFADGKIYYSNPKKDGKIF